MPGDSGVLGQINLGSLRSSGPATQPSAQPLLSASDGQSLWLVRPLTVDTGKKRPAFEILMHPVNRRAGDRDLWLPVVRDQQRYFVGQPILAAAMTGAEGPQVCVIMQDGQAVIYSMQSSQPLMHLPAGIPVAALGRGGELYVLTRQWPPVTGQMASATGPATSQSAAATLPSSGEKWLLWAYRAGKWEVLSSPGEVTDPYSSDVAKSDTPLPFGATPTSAARVKLAVQNDRIVLLWIEPTLTRYVHARSMILSGADQKWSPRVTSDLPEDAQSFFAFPIEPRIYLAWIGSDGREQVLSGGALDSEFRFSPKLSIDRVPLGFPVSGPLASHDITISRTGEAVAVMYEISGTDEAALGSVMLSNTGRILYPAQTIIPDIKDNTDSSVLQHSAMILLILLVAVALWQWRKRPLAARMPAQLRAARLYQRLIAALIDLAIAFGVVVLMYGYYNDDLLALLKNWFMSIIQLDRAMNQSSFLMMFVIYIGHVTISELLTCRTIGKKIVGLRVVAIDGSRPGKVSLLLRNLMRVPELVTSMLLIYMVMNDQRQRLGDLIARTMVVQERGNKENAGDSENPGGEE